MKILEKIKEIKEINPNGTYLVEIDTDDMKQLEIARDKLFKELPLAKLIFVPFNRIKFNAQKSENK